MRIIIVLFFLGMASAMTFGQHSAQNTELRQLSKSFISSVKQEGDTYNEAVEFSIVRDTVVIHCMKWMSSETEKNEFVYLLPIKVIGDIELKEVQEEAMKVSMISITCNSGLPDFIFKFGSEKDVRQEMAGGVSEDDMTVYVTVTLPVITDGTKYERLRDILSSFK